MKYISIIFLFIPTVIFANTPAISLFDKINTLSKHQQKITIQQTITENPNMPTSIKLYSKLLELENNYNQAYKRENSLENRILSGLTMAATGIGGMELARGLAEQKADTDAERDMTAYMATFQCKIGNKTYSGGTTDIATSSENKLIKLYQEYIDLAKDLKKRKEALGMKPGIESAVILDSSTTNLYDDKGTGIQNGTYASKRTNKN